MLDRVVVRINATVSWEPCPSFGGFVRRANVFDDQDAKISSSLKLD